MKSRREESGRTERRLCLVWISEVQGKVYGKRRGGVEWRERGRTEAEESEGGDRIGSAGSIQGGRDEKRIGRGGEGG